MRLTNEERIMVERAKREALRAADQKETFWQTFWELFRESVIIQSILTLLVVGTICFLVLTEQSIPEEMWAVAGIVVGYWFGAKNTSAVKSALKAQAGALFHEYLVRSDDQKG